MKVFWCCACLVFVGFVGLGSGLEARWRPVAGFSVGEFTFVDPHSPAGSSLSHSEGDPGRRVLHELSFGGGYFFQSDFAGDSDRMLLAEGLLGVASSSYLPQPDLRTVQLGGRVAFPVGEDLWGLSMSYLGIKTTYNWSFGATPEQAFFQVDLELVMRFVLHWSPFSFALGWRQPTQQQQYSSWILRFGFLRFLIPLGA